MNLADNLARTAAEHGDRIAIKLDDFELTYTQLDAPRRGSRTCSPTRASRPATGSGSCCPNVPYFAACYYGVLRSAAWSCR